MPHTVSTAPAVAPFHVAATVSAATAATTAAAEPEAVSAVVATGTSRDITTDTAKTTAAPSSTWAAPGPVGTTTNPAAPAPTAPATPSAGLPVATARHDVARAQHAMAIAAPRAAACSPVHTSAPATASISQHQLISINRPVSIRTTSPVQAIVRTGSTPSRPRAGAWTASSVTTSPSWIPLSVSDIDSSSVVPAEVRSSRRTPSRAWPTMSTRSGSSSATGDRAHSATSCARRCPSTSAWIDIRRMDIRIPPRRHRSCAESVRCAPVFVANQGNRPRVRCVQ